MIEALAAHYATALADAVFAPDSGLPPEEALRQLNEAAATVTGSPELENALLSPAVQIQQKRAVIDHIAASLQLNRLLNNFLKLLVDHRRVSHLKAICDEFETVVNQRTGWIAADIRSAHPLDEGERQQVERALGTSLGRFIRARYRVDESLIAGLKAQVGDTIYDASIEGRLNRLRDNLGASR